MCRGVSHLCLFTIYRQGLSSILNILWAEFPISKATEKDNEDDDYDDDDDDDDDWILLTHIDFKINATALDQYNGRRSGCFSTTPLFSVTAIPNYIRSNCEKKTAINNIIPFNNVQNFFIYGIDNPKCDIIQIGHDCFKLVINCFLGDVITRTCTRRVQGDDVEQHQNRNDGVDNESTSAAGIRDESGGDLTGLKLWLTTPLPMIHHLTKIMKQEVMKKKKKKNQPTIRILELGSGCGLLGLGLTASMLEVVDGCCCDCQVIMTDANITFRENDDDDDDDKNDSIINGAGVRADNDKWTSSLQWLESNVELNALERFVTVAPLEWGNDEHLETLIATTTWLSPDYDYSDDNDANNIGSSDQHYWVVGSEILYNNDSSFEGLIKTLWSLPGKPHIYLGYKVRRLGESKFFKIAEQSFDVTWTKIGKNRNDHLQLAKLMKRPTTTEYYNSLNNTSGEEIGATAPLRTSSLLG